MPHECTLNRAFRLAGTNFGHLSSFAAADATSAFDPKRSLPINFAVVQYRVLISTM